MNDAISHERSSLRAGRLLKAQMQHPRLGMVDILVRNISEGGMGGKCRHGLEPGEVVRIVLPNLPPADGLIVWRMGDGFGVRWNTPLDPTGVTRPVASTPRVIGYEVPDLFRPPLECRRPAVRSNC
ncbi:PilZ domain-containing protein [Sphingobium herbicidovorans]|uniref:PilZ domain-containing protein n=1 Tax=Sphingobium herbicidovorans TaxID=76947 RepID=UPI0012FE3147|nr:PilZ domain-containing protein [Sphingobium herbicidovorans]